MESFTWFGGKEVAYLRAKMPTPGETAGACAYYGDKEAQGTYIVEIECRFTEEANR